MNQNVIRIITSIVSRVQLVSLQTNVVIKRHHENSPKSEKTIHGIRHGLEEVSFFFPSHFSPVYRDPRCLSFYSLVGVEKSILIIFSTHRVEHRQGNLALRINPASPKEVIFPKHVFGGCLLRSQIPGKVSHNELLHGTAIGQDFGHGSTSV